MAKMFLGDNIQVNIAIDPASPQAIKYGENQVAGLIPSQVLEERFVNTVRFYSNRPGILRASLSH